MKTFKGIQKKVGLLLAISIFASATTPSFISAMNQEKKDESRWFSFSNIGQMKEKFKKGFSCENVKKKFANASENIKDAAEDVKDGCKNLFSNLSVEDLFSKSTLKKAGPVLSAIAIIGGLALLTTSDGLIKKFFGGAASLAGAGGLLYLFVPFIEKRVESLFEKVSKKIFKRGEDKIEVLIKKHSKKMKNDFSLAVKEMSSDFFGQIDGKIKVVEDKFNVQIKKIDEMADGKVSAFKKLKNEALKEVDDLRKNTVSDADKLVGKIEKLVDKGEKISNNIGANFANGAMQKVKETASKKIDDFKKRFVNYLGYVGRQKDVNEIYKVEKSDSDIEKENENIEKENANVEKETKKVTPIKKEAMKKTVVSDKKKIYKHKVSRSYDPDFKGKTVLYKAKKAKKKKADQDDNNNVEKSSVAQDFPELPLLDDEEDGIVDDNQYNDKEKEYQNSDDTVIILTDEELGGESSNEESEPVIAPEKQQEEDSYFSFAKKKVSNVVSYAGGFFGFGKNNKEEKIKQD